jgi:hypothetical protein
MHPDYILTSAGVIVALAFFVLVACVVTVPRGGPKLAAAVGAVTAIAGALPAAPYALNGMR